MIWGTYVVLADYLAVSESESAKRSAISRAYYGAFNAARRRLEAHGVPIDNHRAHDQVWRTFRSAEPGALAIKEKWRTVGELGGGLRPLRNQADYADAVPELSREAVKAVATAKRIIALLDELEFS